MRPTYRVRQDRTVGGRQARTYFQVGTPLEGAQLVCHLLDADARNPFVMADEYGFETLVGNVWVEWQDREGFPINLAFPDWAWE